MKSLRFISNLIKNYWISISALPLFLGGLYQFLSLTSISISYIKFYSVAQQISDGLIFSLLIITFLIIRNNMNYISLFQFSNELETKSISEILNENIRDWVPDLLAPIFFYFLGKKYFPLISKNQIDIFDFAFYIFYILKVIIFVITLTQIIIMFAHHYKITNHFSIKPKESKESKSRLINILDNLKRAMLVILIWIILGNFDSLNLIPSNNVNIENLLKKVSMENKNSKCEIIYFNDKYIFVGIKNKVQIFKSDEIFK